MAPKPKPTPKPTAMARPAKPSSKPPEVVEIAKATPAPAPAEPDPAPPAEADPPAAAAETPKAKKRKPPKRPPIPLPRDADELIGMKRFDLDRLSWEVSLRLGKAKRHRAELATATPAPEAALIRLNAQIAELGQLLHVVSERRGQLRRAARCELGQIPERSEAIAGAVDSILAGPIYQRVMAEAERILKRAAADLAEAEPVE